MASIAEIGLLQGSEFSRSKSINFFQLTFKNTSGFVYEKKYSNFLSRQLSSMTMKMTMTMASSIDSPDTFRIYGYLDHEPGLSFPIRP